MRFLGQELSKKYLDGIPRMDPIEDMNIRDHRLINAANAIERLEKRLVDNEIFKVHCPP